MEPSTQMLIEELGLNFRAALAAGQFELAEEINKKINRLIKYSTGIES